MPSTSLTLVLGYCLGNPQRVGTAGRVSALCAELRRRGEYDTLIDTLDPALASAITLLEVADRGQVWASGQRRP